MQTELAICKSQNEKFGNGMREMWRKKAGMRGMRWEWVRGISVVMWWICVEMQKMWGIRVAMQGTKGETHVYYNKFIISWTSMFNKAAFRNILLPRWWEKFFSKRSLIKHHSWRDKVIVLWIRNRKALIFLRELKYSRRNDID